VSLCGLAAPTRPSALTAAPLILAVGPSSRGPHDWFTTREGHFETSSCWQGIDPSRQPNAISTAIVTSSAAWWQCYEAKMNSGRKRKDRGADETAERDPTALAHAVDLIFGPC